MSISHDDVLHDLKAGETQRVEFKSTLRWNIKAGRNDDEITHGAMKAIAGFLNKDGGVVYIGVDPNGMPHGLDDDGYKNDDKFTLLLIDTLKRYLGNFA